jgi:hypothetical protein
MENNQLFEADASLDAGAEEQGGQSFSRPGDIGVEAMMAANGGYDKYLASTSEETSLLPGGADRTALPGDGNGGNVGTNWPGEADFEGLPWWKRPSVSLNLLRYNIKAD